MTFQWVTDEAAAARMQAKGWRPVQHRRGAWTCEVTGHVALLLVLDEDKRDVARRSNP